MIHSVIFFVVKAIRKAIRELLVKCPIANAQVSCKLDAAPSNQTFKHNFRTICAECVSKSMFEKY